MVEGPFLVVVDVGDVAAAHPPIDAASVAAADDATATVVTAVVVVDVVVDVVVVVADVVVVDVNVVGGAIAFVVAAVGVAHATT